MYEYTVLERGDAKDCRGLSTSGREKLMYNNRGRPWGGLRQAREASLHLPSPESKQEPL